jgi:hypothetical protein
MNDKVWVFNGAGARLPSGVFTSRTLAEAWISKHQLSGLLTEYPVDIGVLEWAIEAQVFAGAEEKLRESGFAGRFTSAYMQHAHYELGRLVE